MHRYSSLLSGAASGLQCASCLHIDDIGRPIDLDQLLEETMVFFDRNGEKPKRVAYAFPGESKHRRSSLHKFTKTFAGGGHALANTIQSITITSAGFEGGPLSDTWTPRVAISIGLHGEILEAFFQSSKYLQHEQNNLAELAFRIARTFSSAYIFEYPFVFSPLAYASGLIYDPNVKQWGNHTDQDMERVTNWANHCYRGRRASEGYLRDVYPLNLIGLEHTERFVGRVKLLDWIGQDPARGSLSRFKEKTLWEVASKNIQTIRRELDRSEILLSGFPPK